ncbi:Acetolactate synthase large subunit IlvB1 [Baekduia alba]|uniref:thiamine pyrophosphate-binding protein n=1 Tax=Baekduia alba TaxID=2997333 RepID=UPI0023411152|nr:thiamine pyrophosphate-binding protein [Baekduia alba]WCB91918.1 Acetolactate synthase large subunit IlvB1 [Baekduia alba]
MPTGGDELVAALERAGVDTVFGLPGVHNLPAWEALRTSPIRLVGVRHEQAAVYAADGYARATGKVGVALVTTGPGAANTLGATGEAWASGSPVVVIATDIPTSLKRRGIVGGALHEAEDQQRLFSTLTKQTFRLDAPGDVERAVNTAYEAPRGPVFVEIPTDRLSAVGPTWDVGEFAPDVVEDEPEGVQQALELLAGTWKPLIVAGGGAIDAGPEVAELARRLGAPVLTTYSARGLLGRDDPRAVDLPPHLPAIGELWDEADVLIAIGTDLDGMNTMNWRLPRPPNVVAVNVDPADASKNYLPDVVVAGDAALGARALAAGLPPAGADVWASVVTARRRARGAVRGDHPQEIAFLETFARVVGDDVNVVADMCIPGYWLAAMYQPAGPRRFQYPMGWGTLGYAFPAALGAAIAGPTLSVSGDGGFLFACGELATAKQERLPLTALVVDDGGYGMLRFDQRHSGTETYGVDLETPDFVRLADAFGIRATAVDGLSDDFGTTLASHLADPEPTLLVARAALTPPPTTSPRWHRQGPPTWADPLAGLGG